jgi:hypothetical protein
MFRRMIHALLTSIALAAGHPVEMGELPPRSRPFTAPATGALLLDDAAGPVLPMVRLEIDERAWSEVTRGEVAWIDGMPLSDGDTADLRMTRVDPFTRDARIVVMEAGPDGRTIEREVPRPEISAWVGTVAGRPGSRAFIARSEAGLHGYIQFEGRTEIISSGDPKAHGPAYISNGAALPLDEFHCGAIPAPDHEETRALRSGTHALTAPCRQLPIAFETDQELLTRMGTIPAGSAYVATLVAALTDIYQRDFNTRPSICFLRWWTTTDPWTQTGTCGGSGSDQLGELRNWWNANMQSTPRALTAMLSGRSLGGGCAWLYATCSDPYSGYGYSVSANLNGSFPYPIISQNGGNWDLYVVAHEIGHNLSCYHTHDIGVDGCGNGDCSLRLQGTIMSYCHQCSGGVANINMNFDPVNIGSVEDHLSYSGCTFPEATDPVALADTYSMWEGTPSVLDVLANDLRSNCESVEIASLPSTSARGVPLVLLPTGSPSNGPAIGYTPGAGVRGTDSFTYRLRDSSNQLSSTVTVSIDVKPILAATSGLAGNEAGLRGRYYALNAPTSMPDFDALTPYQFVNVPLLSFGATQASCVGSGRSDNFGVVFEGWILAPSEGNYTFSLTSDAGSQLFLDGFKVIDHDGIHTFSEKTGTVYLKAGYHALRIPFFEYTGACGLQLKWAPPGTTSRVFVPSTALSRGGQIYDLDASGTVDSGDLAYLLLGFGGDCSSGRCYGDPNDRQYIGFEPPCACPEDLDGSGEIDFGDVALLLLY